MPLKTWTFGAVCVWITSRNEDAAERADIRDCQARTAGAVEFAYGGVAEWAIDALLEVNLKRNSDGDFIRNDVVARWPKHDTQPHHKPAVRRVDNIVRNSLADFILGVCAKAPDGKVYICRRIAPTKTEKVAVEWTDEVLTLAEVADLFGYSGPNHGAFQRMLSKRDKNIPRDDEAPRDEFDGPVESEEAYSLSLLGAAIHLAHNRLVAIEEFDPVPDLETGKVVPKADAEPMWKRLEKWKLGAPKGRKPLK